MKTWQRYFRLTGIRRQLVLFALAVVLILSSASAYSYYEAHLVMRQTNDIFRDYEYVNNLYTAMNDLEADLEDYLATQSSYSLMNYYSANNKLQTLMEQRRLKVGTDERSLQLEDVYNMTKAFLHEADAAVYARRGGMISLGLSHQAESKQIAGYIHKVMNDLIYSTLNSETLKYQGLQKKVAVSMLIGLSLIIFALGLSVVLIFVFTYRITKPVVELAEAAQRIAREDFDVKLSIAPPNNEIGILAKTFNQMVVSLQNYLANMRQKAVTENRLREQEMQNLRMRTLLRDAEYKALQAQINPHFFFNTLNHAAQLAMLEEAEKSYTFIQQASELFRYSLKGWESPVTLGDEVKNVSAYAYILKARFQDRVKFEFEIDEEALGQPVPGLIVQPLVENAFIHGLEHVTRQGLLKVRVFRDGERTKVEVTDNGQGISEERLEELRRPPAEGESGQERMGIGLYNVRQRLEIFYGQSGASLLEIYSQAGRGTRVCLSLPGIRGRESEAGGQTEVE
ncbi:Two component system, signal transduction histidine kinase [Acididesulfobacillus acetoxydans]|uniref:histidine kinase n=1 Tax=Acididesulfobacillus acetoxydans TaxID=1561005 RepID=A0A8S0W1V7_9FIRM|nr:histidine kinase [Acididesulfobacillus acetoxydans]CAA7600008.1 Two component system, signal transduction histidine kinase [Acididesulfobacillus acetoxydans]CEJ05994.1 Histidine kinase protein [Acididesulfobacillus acetoxydans]